MSILVYVDQYQGTAKPVSWEMLGKARELAGKLNTRRRCGCHRPERRRRSRRRRSPTAPTRCSSWTVRSSRSIATAAYAAALRLPSTRPSAKIILAPATTGARDVAAMAAAECNIGLAAEVTDLDVDANGKLVAERPVFSGNIIATIVFYGDRQMATVRVRSFPMPEQDAQAGRARSCRCR